MGSAYTQFRSIIANETEFNTELVKMQQEDQFTILSVVCKHLTQDVNEYHVLFHVTVRSTEADSNVLN